MELIYLWCENYHNIHNCGFSFSHDWIVDYRKETKELFIHRNHLNKRVNPYPNYISNVTAIIGKNGTGKSSLLDILGWQFRSFQFDYASFFQVYYLDNNKFLISLFTNSSAPYVLSDSEENTNDEVMEKNYESSLIVNIQDDPKNGCFKFERKVIANLNHETLSFEQEYNEKLFLFPKKRPSIPIQYFFPVEEIKINSEFHTPGDYFIDRFKISECGFEDKYHFLCEFGYHRRKIYGGLLYGDVIFEIRKPYDHNGLNILLPEDDFEFVFGEKIQFNKKYEPKPGVVPNFSELLNRKKLSYKNEYLIDFIGSYFKRVIRYLPKQINLDFFKQKNGNDYGEYLCQALIVAEKINKAYDKDGIEGYFHFSKIVDILRKLPDNFFYLQSICIPNNEYNESANALFKLFDDFSRKTDPTLFHINYAWRGMSDGEEQFVNVMHSLISVINSTNGLRHGIILLDEVDNKMHPETARRFLAALIDTLGLTKVARRKGTFQIIFVSHSPLLISDVTSDSVLLLQKDDNGKCCVSSPKVETFGSNIHELLATSFFMDRTIGLFAEQYISSLSKEISNFGDKLSSKTNAQYKADEFAIKIHQFHEHIDLIGEPVIRQLLEEKLEEQIMKRAKTQEKISKGFMRDLVQKLQEFQDQT